MSRVLVLLALLVVAGCRFDLPAYCGDGVVDKDIGEVCDDGNDRWGDGCSYDCMSSETCGNGIADPDEECDDGNKANDDNCLGCMLSRCGDGHVANGYEQCDDGNAVTETCQAGQMSCIVCDEYCRYAIGAPG
jgi:cysteine-rich repeat protein